MTPRPDKTPFLTLTQLNALTRQCWPEYTTFDAATYYRWPGAAAYLYPNVTPRLHPDGATSPLQLLQALVARGVLRATSYVLLVTLNDLGAGGPPDTTLSPIEEEPHEPDTTTPE